TKRQSLVVSGQEVLSADAFLPKLGAVAEFAVTDPHLAHSRDEGSYLTAIQTSVQFALRQIAASRTAEDLAKLPRDTLDAELLDLVTRDCGGLGIAIETVRLRDIVLPADLRRLLTGVEKARREGQAALERAHAEQAALRALANAARMLRNNPELQNLRLLQAIGSTTAPVTIVLGTQAGIVPLRQDGTEA
ncbi:MAG: SPFH domain-containing protein, partial [Janthinobacterium lividum]